MQCLFSSYNKDAGWIWNKWSLFSNNNSNYSYDPEKIRGLRNDFNELGYGVEGFKNKTKMSDEVFEKYLKTVDPHNASLSGFQIWLNSTGTGIDSVAKKTKLLTIGMTALSTVLNFVATAAIITAISKAGKAISDYIHRNEIAIDKAKDAQDEIEEINSSYEAQKKVVEECASAYDKLSKGVDSSTNKNISLSTEDYNKYLAVNKEIAEAFPSLIQGFDDQGNAILGIGTSSSTAREELDKLLQKSKETAEFKISDQLPTLFAGVGAKAEEASKKISSYNEIVSDSSDAIENIKTWNKDLDDIGKDNSLLLLDMDKSGAAEYANAIDDILKKLNVSDLSAYQQSDYDSRQISFNLASLTDEQLEDFKTRMQSDSDEISDIIEGFTDTVGTAETRSATELEDVAMEWQDLIPTIISGTHAKSTYKQLSEEEQALVDEFIQSISPEEIINIRNDYGDDISAYIREQVIKPIKNATPEVKSAFKELFEFNIGESGLSPEDVEYYLGYYEDVIAAALKKTPSQIKKMFGTQQYHDLYKFFEDAVDNASSKFGVSKDKVENVLKRDLRITSSEEIRQWNAITEEVESLTEAVKKYSEAKNTVFESPETTSYKDTLSKLDGMNETFSKLKSFYEKFKSPDEKIELADLSGLKEAFKIVDGVDHYVESIERARGNSEKTQSSINSLTSAYIEQSKILDIVNGSNAALIQTTLEEWGITNADTLVQQALSENLANAAAQRWLAANASINLSDATTEEVQSLINEGVEAGIAEGALIKLVAGKIAANNTAIVTDGDIMNLRALAIQAGATKEAINGIKTTTGADGIAGSTGPGKGRWYSNHPEKIKEDWLNLINESVDSNLGGGTRQNSSYGPSVSSEGGSGSGSGSDSTEKEFNWIERRRKMLQEEYSRLDKQAGNSFLTYLGISDSDITEAKNLVSTVASAIGNNFSAVSAVLQDSGSSGADGIDQVLQAIQEYETVRRSSFTQSVSPEEIFDDLGRLSSMADTAGLSLEEFIDLIQNGGNESRESALAAKIALGEKQLETYSEDVDAFAAKYQDALNQLPDNIREDIKNKVEHGWKDVELFSGDEADAIQKVIDAQEDLTEAQDVYYDKVMEQQSDIQELYENRIAALEAENDKLSHSNTLIEKQIEYMEASGQIVSAESYEAMIDNMEKQQAVIEKQIKVKKAELKALLESDEQFKDSEAYDSLLKSIDSLEEAYADLDIEIENTNNDLLKKPIENMSIIIGMYGDITTAIQNWGAEMQAAGQKVDADYYQALIGNGRTMISQYKEQADLISDIMDEFEVGSSQWNDLYNQLNSVNGEMSSLVQNMHEWNQELLQLPLTSINEQVEQLQQAKQGFENLQNDYDSVISTVTTAIDRQKEKLADENEEQNDLLQAQIDAAQERYDLLQDQNEQLDLQRRYEQALYDLQEANTQKTERVIRNGEITYEQNADNLRNAQESLQDALEALNEYDLQKYIDDLNDQLDDINDQYEDQIEALDKMAEKWKKIKEDSEYYYNSMLAAQYIGENWEGKILTGNDNDIYSAFKKDYDENAAIIDKYDKQITATENIYSLLQNYISSYQSGSLSYEQTMMGVQTLLSQMNQEMSSGQNVQNILGYLGAVNQTNADANAVLTGIQSALDESSDQMISNLEQYNDNLSLIADCMTSWETVVDNTNKMVNLLEEVRDNLEDALEEARDRDDDDDDGGSSGHWLSGDSGNGPGVHAKGILAGKIGGDANAEKDKMLKYLATHELESGQVPIIADKGEYVINPEQQDNLLANALRPGFVLEDVMKNLQNIDFYPGSNLQLPRYKMPNIAQKSTGDIIVNYTGDIKLTDVRDVDGFARAMASQFKGLMRQELGKR